MRNEQAMAQAVQLKRQVVRLKDAFYIYRALRVHGSPRVGSDGGAVTPTSPPPEFPEKYLHSQQALKELVELRRSLPPHICSLPDLKIALQ